MDDISKVILKPLRKKHTFHPSPPYTVHFTQNGMKKTWDLFMVRDSVAVVIFNTSRNVLVFVRQFRPVVYYGSIPKSNIKLQGEVDVSTYPPENGITIELCAGKVTDKHLPLPEVAKKEILEKCCYDVPLSNLERISAYCSGVGLSGNSETTFYCEVTDDMKIPECEGADIEILEMTVQEVETYIDQVNINSPSSFMFGIYWFLYNKVQKYNKESNEITE